MMFITKHTESNQITHNHSSHTVFSPSILRLNSGDRFLGTYMAPQTRNKSTKEKIIVQELGDSAKEGGSRKRRKSIASGAPTQLNGGTSGVKTNMGVEVNGTVNASPKGRKLNGTTNGIGSRAMLVVGE